MSYNVMLLKTAFVPNSFGSPMDGLTFGGEKYRFGFNGKENDNEVKGAGVQYDYGFRIYDSRLCRFLSVDPLTKSYPWYTPYQFAGNNPIAFIDLDGLEEKSPQIKNVLILINPTAEQIKAINNDKIGNINWHIIIAPTIEAAATQFKTDMGENKADYVVIRSHGSTSGPALDVDVDLDNPSTVSSGKIVRPEQVTDFANIGTISSSGMEETEETYISNYGNSKLSTVKSLMEITSGIKDGGSIIFSDCNVGQGTFTEELVTAEKKVHQKNINVYANQDYSSAYRGHGMLNFSLTTPADFMKGFVKSYQDESGKVKTDLLGMSLQLNKKGKPVTQTKPDPLIIPKK